MQKMRDCIVTVLDLPDIKELSGKQMQNGSTPATKFMTAMRGFAESEMANMIQEHEQAYVWTDSILLLAFLDSPSKTCESVLKEADCIKLRLDKKLKTSGYHKRTFATAVKGQTFPGLSTAQPRVVVLQASGYAMANCFEIPKQFRSSKNSTKTRTISYEWYLDSRIHKSVKSTSGISEAKASKKIQLLPRRVKPRLVYAYGGYLFPTRALVPPVGF